MLEKDNRLSEEAMNSNFGISNAAPLASEPSAPAAPTNLVATAISSSQIDLTWQDNSFNEDGFIVKRRQDNDPSAAFVDLFTTGPNVTTYADTAVQPNITYTYRVRAFRNSGGGAASNEATVTTPRAVAAPSNLQARASDGRIDLTWQDNSFNEDGFIVKRRQDNDPGAAFVDLFTTGPNVTTYADTAVQPNTTYTYRLRAFRNSGGGAASNDATVTTPPPVTAPSNLKATAGEGRVDLAWQDNSNNEDGFTIKRRLASETTFTDIAIVGVNVTTYADTQIQANTSYVYRVRAFRNSGGGAASNDATVTTLAPVTAPSNLRATAGEGRVDLAWQDNSNNEDGFTIKRRLASETSFTDIAIVGVNVTTYADTQIQANTSYVYRVRAFRNSGGGAASNDATVTTLAPVTAPSNLRATAGEGRVDLAWQDNSFNEDGFIVKRRLADPAASFVDLATVGPNITTYTDTTVQPITAYVYRVRAFRNAGGGAASNDASVTTLAPVAAPSNLRATASEARVDLIWQDDSSNEDGFIIKRKVGTDPNVAFVDLFTTGPNATTYSDATIQPNTSYTYRVRAFRNAGGGAASNDASVTTLPPVAAPTNLRAVAAEGRVDLSWVDNSNNEDGFVVKRKLSADPNAAFIDLFTAGPNVTTYSDAAVQPNTVYTYRVRAFRNTGGGAASNDATVTTLPLVAAPSNLQALASDGKVVLTWQDNSNNEDGFIVKRRVGADPNVPFVDLFTTAPNVTSYTDSSVQPNTTYVYRVRAFRSAGGGAASNDATVTTPPASQAPDIIQFSPAAGPEGIDVTVSGATLTGATAVRFNGIRSSDFVVTSPTSITAEVPDGATSGFVSVSTPGGTLTSAASYTLTAAVNQPSIAGFTPASGRTGTSVRITGQNFVRNDTTVIFPAREKPKGRVRVPAVVESPMSLRVVIPPEAETGPLIVKTSNGKSAPSAQELIIGPPFIDIPGFTPASGKPGVLVTITGENFVPGETTVRFNGVPTAAPTVTIGWIIASLPAGATTGPITVETPQGTARSETAFTVEVQPPPDIRFLEPSQIRVGRTGVVIVEGSDLPTTADGYALLDSTRQPTSGVRVLSATVTATMQVAVELLVDASAAPGPYQLQAKTPAGADAEPLELVPNDLVAFAFGRQVTPFMPPLAQNTGFQFILSYGEIEPSIVILYTDSTPQPFGFITRPGGPENVQVDKANGTYSLFVDAGGPWIIQAIYESNLKDIISYMVISPRTTVERGQPRQVDISRKLARHSILFRPTNFQGQEITPSTIVDLRAMLSYRITHRQTGIFIGQAGAGFGRPNRILVSDVSPEHSFSAIGGVGRQFGMPLHLYLYLIRKGIRADLELTNSAAQLARRDITAPSTPSPLFVIPRIFFLDYSSMERLEDFPRVGGIGQEFVSTMLGSDGRAPFYVLHSTDTPLNLSDPANARTPEFPIFRLGLFPGDRRPASLSPLLSSPFFAGADQTDSFLGVDITRGQFDQLDVPIPGQIPLGTNSLFDATVWARNRESRSIELRPQHFVLSPGIGGITHLLADGSFQGSPNPNDDVLREDVTFKLFRNGAIALEGTLEPIERGRQFFSSEATGSYRFLMQHPGLASTGSRFPFMTRSTFTAGPNRDSNPPALRMLQLRVGGKLAGAIDPSAGVQNILFFTVDPVPGEDANGAPLPDRLQTVTLAVSKDAGAFERVAVTTLANKDQQAILPPVGSATRFDFKLSATDLAGNRLVSRFSLPVGSDRGPGPAIAPDTAFTTSTASLSFSVTQGNTPVPQDLALRSADDPIGYAITADVPWLSLTAASGTTPATVMVAASAAGLAAGTYQGRLTVAADDVTIAPTLTVPVTLTVNAQQSAGATLSATPASQSIAAGQSTSYTITLTRTNFAGAVNLSVVSGLPNGATASFNEDSTTGTSSVLTVATTAGTPPGTSDLTIMGLAPGVAITPITVSLTVRTPLTISGFSPPSGMPGTGVTISGTNLDTVTAVQFSGLNAAFNLVNPTLITATVPAGATSGVMTLLAKDGSRASSAQAFTVTAVAPNAPSNLTATVVGLQIQLRWQDNSAGQSGFKVERKVTGSAYQIVGTLERGVTSFVDASVTPGTLYSYRVKAFSAAAESTPSNEASVTVPPPVPAVKLSASPTQLSVIAGQSVRCAITIGRANFTAALNLSLGALPVGLGPVFSANPASGDSSALTFNTSADASPGTYNVSISATAPGIQIAPITVTLKVAAPPPSITGFTPTNGPWNTSVTISGSDFTGATEVRFNGVLAAFTIASRNSITAFVPFVDATRPIQASIQVLTPGGTASSPTSFTIIPPSKEKEKEKEGLKEKEKERMEGKGIGIETSFQAAGVAPPSSARLADTDHELAGASWQHFIGRPLRPTLNQGLFEAESQPRAGDPGARKLEEGARETQEAKGAE